MSNSALTERRKADRTKMAAIVADIARECGATAQVTPRPYEHMSPHMIQVTITTDRGLNCLIDFDGESCQPDTFVNPWNIGLDSDACLSDRFPGSVNRYHFRKSTTVCEGFEELCDHVRQVLEMARDGSAFDLEREARHVAENGTWQERAARFESYLTEAVTQKSAN